MTKFGYTFRTLSLFSLVFLFSACDAASTKASTTPLISDFDKLCEIYKDIAGEYKKTNDRLSSDGNLYKRIKAELPNMLDDYDHIFNTPRKERYQLYQEVAEIRIKQKWNCPAAESYYSDK